MVNSGNTITHSNTEVHKIRKIEFGILNPEEIVKGAVAKIENTQVTDPDGNPLRGGPNDPRMGTVDKNMICETCKSNNTDCPGHYGYIELAEPMYHIGFIEECKKILKCVCYKCSRLLVDTTDKKYLAARSVKNPKKRQNLMFKLCSTQKECKSSTGDDESTSMQSSKNSKGHYGCGQEQPKYKKDPRDQLKIMIEFKESTEEIANKSRSLTAGECLKIFRKMSQEDCEALGFDYIRARPEWMILTVLLVCPPPVRPSVCVDGSLRSEDDLTYQYTEILKINAEIKKQVSKGAPGTQIQDYLYMLQFLVATLMNNEISTGTTKQRSGRPIKAISSRLKGKEGRLRGNLMGKRVDFSARTVITPDPNLSLDELGVPMSIAKNMTFPEVVTPLNIDYIRKLIENGPTEWPGAKYIVRDDGKRVDLRYPKKKSDVHLDFGYIVERHMQDGDIVLFNRQPSLHKMSIMGHRVKILPYSTFRLNLSVTTPYNADFDGDEMNMHLPQSQETKAEILEIMHVPRQIVSPQSNKPVMGIVQDSLIGVKLFTHRDTFIPLDVLMNLLMWIPDFSGEIPMPAILKPKPLWTGKQLFSLILPQVNLTRFTSNYDEKKEKESHSYNVTDTIIHMENGELIMGIVCKRTIGNASGGLIHTIWNEYGPERTMIFLNSTQRLVNQWLLYNGFTVGISDTISDDEISRKIEETLEQAKNEVNEILKQAQEGTLESQPGKSMLESFEAKVNGKLNAARDKAGKYVQNSLSNNNHIKNMVIAGSKGSFLNISQIIACVGQQNVEGKRIPFAFRKRTLPHFTKDDFGPESRGFVQNSYLSGLTPQEFFFHAMGGREGLIDTAVKTSETGYIQRRLVKALEDVMIKYDGTVRNSLGHILQFLYGEDGMAGEFIEDQRIKTLLINDKRLKSEYCFFDENLDDEQQIKELEKSMEPEVIQKIMFGDVAPKVRLALDNEFKKIEKNRKTMREVIFKSNDDKQHIPVNMTRIIWNAKKRFGINIHNKSDIDPLYLLEKVAELKKKLILVKGNDSISVEAQKNATKLFRIVIGYNLASKKIIQNQKLSQKSFDWILGEIESRFYQAIVQPGEMVGNIGAQSMGEPATQMTLNTFHHAGISSKNVTLGVPRLKEVINVTKKLKTPSMTVYLKPEISSKEDSAKKLQASIEHTTMMNITLSSEIYYDPDPTTTIIQEDLMMVDTHIAFNQDDQYQADKLSPWVLRIVFDNDSIIDKNLKIDYIKSKIEKKYKGLEIMESDLNMDKLILRIRFMWDESNKATKEELFTEGALKILETCIIKDLSLKGIPEIKKVYVKKVPLPYFDVNGDFIRSEDKLIEWVIETDGTNLIDTFKKPEVDFTRTATNDILEIYKCLGVEAVRKALLNELRAVLKPYDVYVNYRHTAILCDVMTHRGVLTAITRHGINRAELGPLRKCSFEETVEILLEAGLFSENDNLTGISENIMLGQLAPLGTGSFDLMLDEEKVKLAKSVGNLRNTGMDPGEDLFYMRTPLLDSSPTQGTPYESNTPRLYNNPSQTGQAFTPGVGQSFTPYEQGMVKSPSFNFNSKKDDLVYITTPGVATTPNSASSPLYNPNPNTDQYKSPYLHPYSPIVISEDDYYPKNTSKQAQSPYSPGSPVVDTPNSFLGKSPYTPAGGSKTHGTSSNVIQPSENNTYSPSNVPPQYGASSTYSSGSPRYKNTTSPGYYGSQGNYSPSTSMYNKNSVSPEYSNYKNSNYSGGSSPRVQDSGGSPGSQQQYSPKSPAYNNVKSPSYNNKIGGTGMNTLNSPFYNANLINNQNYDPKDQKKKKTGPESSVHSDEENEDKDDHNN